MDRPTAIEQIKDACKNIAREMMRLNPAISGLGDADVQKELYETVYQLTKDVETIKKKVIKLESRDESSLL
jgi:hypothetical protein